MFTLLLYTVLNFRIRANGEMLKIHYMRRRTVEPFGIICRTIMFEM